MTLTQSKVDLQYTLREYHIRKGVLSDFAHKFSYFCANYLVDIPCCNATNFNGH